jgi:alpha-ketoglutarate-dependent taurine dioxygenase
MSSFDLEQLLTPSGVGCACVLVNRGEDDDPMNLDRDEVIRLYKEHGAILFRGFAFGGDERFKKFTERFGRDFFIHPSVNRDMVSSDDTVQTVDYGRVAITVHGEFSYLPYPLRPEMGWFYCVRPTERGGQTTICDSTQIPPRLSPEARAMFEAQRLRFVMRFPEVIWRRFFKTSSVEEVLAQLRQHSIEKSFRMEDNILYLDHVADSLQSPKFTNREGFVNNSIFYHSKDEPGMAVFEDGEQFPAWLVEELAGLAASLTAEVNWQKDDLLMFDNTRMLHGRRELLDDERVIYTRWCHASF